LLTIILIQQDIYSNLCSDVMLDARAIWTSRKHHNTAADSVGPMRKSLTKKFNRTIVSFAFVRRQHHIVVWTARFAMIVSACIMWVADCISHKKLQNFISEQDTQYAI